MGNRLFVGNLSWGIDDDQLREIFSAVGNVTDAVVIRDFRGRSKGFGFVTLETEEEANKAKSELDGTDQDGRPINVDIAHDRKQKDDNRSDDNSAPSDDSDSDDDAGDDADESDDDLKIDDPLY